MFTKSTKALHFLIIFTANPFFFKEAMCFGKQKRIKSNQSLNRSYIQEFDNFYEGLKNKIRGDSKFPIY